MRLRYKWRPRRDSLPLTTRVQIPKGDAGRKQYPADEYKGTKLDEIKLKEYNIIARYFDSTGRKFVDDLKVWVVKDSANSWRDIVEIEQSKLSDV